VSGDFDALADQTDSRPVKTDLLNGCVVYTRLAGKETHLEIADFLENIFSKFLEGEVQNDLIDVPDDELARQSDSI